MATAAVASEHKGWDRADFPTPQSFAWARVWYAFLLREAQHDGVDIPEDASVDDIKHLRMDKKLCVDEVILHTQTNTATFAGTLRIRFGQKLSLSRVAPENDGWKHFLEVESSSVRGSLTFKDTTRWPPDASDGSWRLDVQDEDHQTPNLMWHIWEFAKKSDDPLHQLIIGGLPHDGNGLDRIQKSLFCCPSISCHTSICSSSSTE